MSTILNAQNLVLNPSFEEYEICPDDHKQFTGYVNDWQTFFTTPDYFNLCGYYPPFIIQTISAEPRTGDGLAGCSWYKTVNAVNIFREYIHGHLSESMEANEVYYGEYYAFTQGNIYVIDNYQIHFSNNEISDMPSDGILLLPPHIANQAGIVTAQNWVKISGCYTAEGGEEHFTLGNFESNEDTDTLQMSPLAAKHYALIDDVAVYRLSTLIPSDTTIIEAGYVELPNFADQQYYLDGILLEGNEFYPPAIGSYELEVFLETCGFIGSFIVEVIPCIERAATFESALPAYSEVCLEDLVMINLPLHACCAYYLDDNLLEVSELVLSDTGLYEIEVRVLDCTDLETYYVNVLSCDENISPSPVDCFYFPNVFSPNNDGFNDDFRAYGNCEVVSYELQIFDRWGGHIFTSNEINQGWNGKTKQEELESGVYIYTALIEYLTEENLAVKVRLSGDVTLLK